MVNLDQAQRFGDRVVLRPGVVYRANRHLDTTNELNQKLRHKLGLQLEHVLVKFPLGIHMSLDFKVEDPFGIRELALGTV